MWKVRKYEAEMMWESELEWVFRLMPDEVLLKLKDVIEYAIETNEYEKCPISCGNMRFICQMVDEELEVRKMEVDGVKYAEAKEIILSRRKVSEDEDGEPKDSGGEETRGTVGGEAEAEWV